MTSEEHTSSFFAPKGSRIYEEQMRDMKVEFEREQMIKRAAERELKISKRL